MSKIIIAIMIFNFSLALLLPTNCQQQFPLSQLFPSTTFGANQNNNARGGGISTHVLDISIGKPAGGVNCSTFWWDEQRKNWMLVGINWTNDRGRIGSVIDPGFLPPNSGVYKLRFETGQYFGAQGRPTFFPFVEIVFMVDDPEQKYHVPLTLSNFGYSTYRGQ